MTLIEKAIAALNGEAVEIVDGAHVSLGCVGQLNLVLHVIQTTLIIFSTNPLVSLRIDPGGPGYDLLHSIATYEPVKCGEYTVDFHGELPAITRGEIPGSIFVKWRTPPVVDLRFVPDGLDPEIQYAVVTKDAITLRFAWGNKEIAIGEML